MFNCIHRGCIAFFMCLTIVILQQTDLSAAGQLVENWNTKMAHDAAWPSFGENDTQIFVQQAAPGDGELHLIVRPYSSIGDTSSDSRIRFASGTASNLTGLQASVRLEAVGNVAQTPEISFSAIGFGGIFYNVNAAPTDATGDVFFILRFGDRGNGLEVWYEIDVSTNGDFSQATEFATGVVPPPPLGWQLNTPYLFEFDYDENNSFDITFNGTDIIATGPARGDGAFFDSRWIRSRISYLQPFSGNPDVNMLHAVIDDVQVGLNGSGVAPYDDFNSAAAALDTADWRDPARIITVENNMLKMQVKAASIDQYRFSTMLPAQFVQTNFLQSDIQIADGFINDLARGEASLGGYFGNETNMYNGVQGNLFFEARLEKRDGAYRAACSGSKDLDAQGDTFQELFFTVAPINPDTFYTASLQLEGTVFTCTVKDKATGAIAHQEIVDLQSLGIPEVFPTAPGTEIRRLQVRHREFASGEVVAFFDNVFATPGSGNILLNLIPVITNEEEQL